VAKPPTHVDEEPKILQETGKTLVNTKVLSC